jgi:hypothetical protein
VRHDLPGALDGGAEADRQRFERLVADANAAELKVVVDAEAWAIRLVTYEEQRDPDADLRELGVTVGCDSACGTPASRGGHPVM